MAISYLKIIENLKDRELNSEELELVKIAEDFIDSIIKDQIKSSNDKLVNIHNSYFNFNFAHEYFQLKSGNELKFIKELMKKELIARYKKVDWIVSYKYDEGDPPSSPGYGYYELVYQG